MAEKQERSQGILPLGISTPSKDDFLICGCCFDYYTNEEIVQCQEGHVFCRYCIKKYAEVMIGDGRTSFPCFEENCTSDFSVTLLQKVLPPAVIDKLVLRIQCEEIKAARIEGLETCPFCDYSAILVPEDAIFKCLNPHCMKETCRKCKEPSHIPLRCDEVEKNLEVKARTYIEDKMTEALVRNCWKCNNIFIKDGGCNKMKCSCGALMCYICREAVEGCNHFNIYGDRASNLCPLFSDDIKFNERAIEEEAIKAKQKVFLENPGICLKYDPTCNPKQHEKSNRNIKREGLAVHNCPPNNDGLAVHNRPPNNDGLAVHNHPPNNDGLAVHNRPPNNDHVARSIEKHINRIRNRRGNVKVNRK